MEINDEERTMTPQIMETCSRLKQVRKMLKMSQKDFAASVGMSQGHLCVIERGEHEPTNTLLKAICYEHKVNEKWLLTGKGEPLTPAVPEIGIPVFDQLPESFPEVSRADDVLGYLSLPGLPKDGFALYQRGDYMAPTIRARDLLICERSDSIKNEDLVLVKNRWGTWIVRRFRKAKGKAMLTPDNSAYKAFEYDKREQHIFAKVSVVLRNVDF
jgi:repressor LexA